MSAPENRLANEASPYLLQHKRNPVDWYPWGPEALEKAKREDKPILLSIGYAACHWCHVMERESFESEATAKLMNELYVNIKVDREERPDLDQIYQLVVQVMGRSGGWPLTVFLTPDQRPYFAGTYFPPEDRYGSPGFPKVLTALEGAYRNQRGDVFEQAKDITNAIDRATRGGRGGPGGDKPALGPDVIQVAGRKLLGRFDEEHGGFGKRPKFPNTMALDVLLRKGERGSVELALHRMAAGGIWDHLRGGFHRYSTDERWLVPHFEKMLYDNALLLRLYADGFRATGRERYRDICRALVGYLFAEMRDDAHGGAFFASQDADSEGEEGKFFVFTPDEVRQACEGDEVAAEVAIHFFGVTEEGNFEDHSAPNRGGPKASVLSEVVPIERVAADLEVSIDEAKESLERARQKLLAFREKRPRPTRDDKVLASWNGLLIGALADAGAALGEPSWIEAAEEAFAAIEERLITNGRAGRFYKDGVRSNDRPGFLDDQAYLGNAALDLYEVTGDPAFVEKARGLAEAMIEHHWDEAEGGFFFAPKDGEALIARTKDLYDQAIPSGASMAALLCLRLGALADASFTAFGEKQLTLAAGPALENPFGLGQAVLGLDRMVNGSTDVVLVGPRGAEKTRALAGAALGAYLPNRTLAWVDLEDPSSIEAAKVLSEDKPGRGGETVAYVCRGRTCSAPVTTPEELAALLAQPA